MADPNDTSTQDENDETVEETQEETQEESTEEVVEEAEEPEAEEDDEPPTSRRDERIQDLVEMNKTLRKLLETRTFTPHTQEADVEVPAFEDADVEKAFNAKLNKERQRM